MSESHESTIAGVGTAHLSHPEDSSDDDDKFVINGIALGIGDVTVGQSGVKKVWPADELKRAAETLAGQDLVRDHINTTEGKVGEVTEATFMEDVGVVYEAEVANHYDELANDIRAGLMEVSVRAYHAPEEELEEDDDGALVVEDVYFDNLSVVNNGASPSNTAETGGIGNVLDSAPSVEASASFSGGQSTATLSRSEAVLSHDAALSSAANESDESETEEEAEVADDVGDESETEEAEGASEDVDEDDPDVDDSESEEAEEVDEEESVDDESEEASEEGEPDEDSEEAEETPTDTDSESDSDELDDEESADVDPDDEPDELGETEDDEVAGSRTIAVATTASLSGGTSGRTFSNTTDTMIEYETADPEQLGDELDDPVVVEKAELENMADEADKAEDVEAELGALSEKLDEQSDATEVVDELSDEAIDMVTGDVEFSVVEASKVEMFDEVQGIYAEELAKHWPGSDAEDLAEKYSPGELRSKVDDHEEAELSSSIQESEPEPEGGSASEEELGEDQDIEDAREEYADELEAQGWSSQAEKVRTGEIPIQD